MELPVQFLCVCLVAWIPLVYSKGPPRIISKVHRHQVARVGEVVKLVCPVQAEPPPLLQWTKDGETINAGWSRFRMLSRALRIKDVTEEDMGRYVCKATNGFGNIDVDYRLLVLPNDTSVTAPPNWEEEEDLADPQGEAPNFLKPEQMRDQHLMRPAGNGLRLKCKAGGKPRPQIIWFKDGNIITGDPEDEVEHISESRWTLKLQKLNTGDSGKYMCKVFNRFGSINHTYTLEVIDRLSKPIIADPYPVNTSVEVGQMASFQCRVHSEVQPSIQWLKRVDNPRDIERRNQNNTIMVKDQQFIVLKTGNVWSRKDGSYLNKLTLQSVTERDAGMYICLGANSMGYSFRSAFLHVIPYTLGGDSIQHVDDGVSSSSVFSLPIMIAIPTAVVVIIIIVLIFVLLKRKTAQREKQHHTHIVRNQRLPPPPPPMDKNYEQYQALQGYHRYQAPSREQMLKNYSDFQSDSSGQKFPMPVPPPQVPMHPNGVPMHPNGVPMHAPMLPQPPMQTFQQHQHMHYPPC